LARLADYLPSIDDESLYGNTPSRQRNRNMQGKTSTPIMSTPIKRDLVPKSTTITSTRKRRVLRGQDPMADNPLFQPWSAQDTNGIQARSQTAMRESPAKLGLVTEFEQDSPPATTRATRVKAHGLNLLALGDEHCSELLALTSLPPSAGMRRMNGGIDSGSSKTRASNNYPDQAISQILSSSSDKHCFDEILLQRSVEKGHSSKTSVTSLVAGDLSNDSDLYTHDAGSLLSLSSESTFRTPLPDLYKSTYTSSDKDHSSMSIYSQEATQNGFNGPLKPLDRNISSPNKTFTKLDHKSAPTGNWPIGGSTPSYHDDEDILNLFEKMSINSRENFTRGSSDHLHNNSDASKPPNSPPKTMTQPSNKHSTPLKPHQTGVDFFRGQAMVDDQKHEGSHRKQNKSALSSELPREDKKKAQKKAFETVRQALAEDFLSELDLRVTDGQIAKLCDSTDGVKIVWTKSLQTTAGRANWRRETVRTEQADGSVAAETHKHHASIELADKVIDDENRLLNVLAHEFCHLTTFMISGVKTNPHGKEFKAWASKCSQIFGYRGVNVTTKHSYDIDFKYRWECTQCGMEYKRHSKSINTEHHRCGTCKGELNQTKPAPRANTKNSGGTSGQSEYQLFVKEQMKLVKQTNPGVSQRDVMGIVAGKWADLKIKRAQAPKQEDTILSIETDEAETTIKSLVDLTLRD
jgi:predicted SprT family Zn-dependent metalloprotease